MLNGREIRMALFKRGMVRCPACGKHLKEKDTRFKEEPQHRRIIVKTTCTNPRCKKFRHGVEWYVPTDKFTVEEPKTLTERSGSL